MEFCKRCKSLMYPNDGILLCRQCGFKKELEGEHVVHSTHHAHEDRMIAVHEGKELAGLPTTKVICPECRHDTAYWWLRQLRSADESEVRFFRCTECKHTWREYD